MIADVRPFQREFMRRALEPGIRIAAMTCPRGNGKSTVLAHLAERIVTPGDTMYHDGAESILLAGSLGQARIVFRMARIALEPTGEYRFTDSSNRIGIQHRESGTAIRLIGANPKTSFGLGALEPYILVDEPGTWEIGPGEMLWDSLTTALGKPGSSTKIIAVGTLAPMATDNSHWWYSLIANGSHGSTYVMAYAGDPETWDDWNTIRKANPLVNVSREFRETLLAERDGARHDSRLRARFLSYRLNVPSGDETKVLLTVPDWLAVEAREITAEDGPPFVGIDLGSGRSWSAAVAAWHSGRIECLVLAPGVPDLAAQARRDRVPAALYQLLADDGVLAVDDGLKVQRPAALWDMVLDRWGIPDLVVCDRFRLGDLEDAIGSDCDIEPRVTRWSEASADIRALRRMAMDGPLNCPREFRRTFAAALSITAVESDTSGNQRLVKKRRDNSGRDDVSAALVLAAGAVERYPAFEHAESWDAIRA